MPRDRDDDQMITSRHTYISGRWADKWGNRGGRVARAAGPMVGRRGTGSSTNQQPVTTGAGDYCPECPPATMPSYSHTPILVHPQRATGSSDNPGPGREARHPVTQEPRKRAHWAASAAMQGSGPVSPLPRLAGRLPEDDPAAPPIGTDRRPRARQEARDPCVTTVGA